MAPKILDEVELQARKQQIIAAAIRLIEEIGIENITMDKVVEQVPFSKGTVYKYFIGKEDLLLAIANYSITILSDLFHRCYQFKGCARVRLLLINFSYLIYAMLHPALFQSVICAKTSNIAGKASEENIKQQAQLEVTLLTNLYGIITQAIDANNLILADNISIQQLCFANWSVAYGAIALLSGDIEECSGRSGLIVERELFNSSNFLFDGMGWQPLSKDKKYADELTFALEQLFSQELALLKAKGRELNFI